MKIFTDGASNEHIGRAGIAVIIKDDDDNIEEVHAEEICLKDISELHSFKKIPSNNDAEYLALIKALKIALNKEPKNLEIFTDSMLVVKQVNKEWKINYDHLQKYNNEIDFLRKRIPFKLSHVRREYNQEADYWSKYVINQTTPAMDKKFYID